LIRVIRVIRENPWPLFSLPKKKTGLVGPASSSVELRCGYITARRLLAPKVPPALFLARSVRMQLLASAEKSESRGTLTPLANTVPITAVIYCAMKVAVTG
jgi:hypothetical protein